MAVRQDLWRLEPRTVQIGIIVDRGGTDYAGNPDTLAAENDIGWSD